MKKDSISILLRENTAKAKDILRAMRSPRCPRVCRRRKAAQLDRVECKIRVAMAVRRRMLERDVRMGISLRKIS